MSSSSSGQFRLVDPENPSRQLVLSYAWECSNDKAASSINLSPTGFAGDSSQQESDDDDYECDSFVVADHEYDEPAESHKRQRLKKRRVRPAEINLLSSGSEGGGNDDNDDDDDNEIKLY
jgi:hypothetical protein